MKKRWNKKGLAGKDKIFIFVILILVAFIVIPSVRQYALNAENIAKQAYEKAQIEKASLIKKPFYWTYYKAKDLLGFNATFWKDFWPDLLVGLFIGLWLLLVNWGIMGYNNFARRFGWHSLREGARTDRTRHKSSWLYTVGGSPWKTIVIAMTYAILLQIPVINSAIKIVTFEFLMSGSLWFGFIRSFIVAFYIGFGPAMFQEIARYRLRQKYYKKIMDAKYGAKIIRATAQA